MFGKERSAITKHHGHDKLQHLLHRLSQHAMQSDASTASPDSSPEENPLWESTPPTSLAAPISPPQLDSTRPAKRPKRAPSPTLAAVEAGEAEIDDHLGYFTKHLSRVIRPCAARVPRLSIAEFRRLYERNSNAQGHHFVIHQHDHPVAGVHYDLRLQFSESSSISFAIPFGVPGDANSVRMGRMAMETRVHNFWVCHVKPFGGVAIYRTDFCFLVSGTGAKLTWRSEPPHRIRLPRNRQPADLGHGRILHPSLQPTTFPTQIQGFLLQ